MNRILVVGGGGHVRVLIEAMEYNSDADVIGLVDNDEAAWGTSVLGIPIVGGDDCLKPFAAQHECDSFVIGIGAITHMQLRKRLFDNALASGLSPFTVRHPSSQCSPSAEIAGGCHLLALSFVNAGAQVGENVIINTAAIIEHDCRVGAHSHIAPRACLAGGVKVGTQCHVGMGAVVRENLSIGDRAVIGAGAVVVCDVPADTVVVGVPARHLKRSQA